MFESNVKFIIQFLLFLLIFAMILSFLPFCFELLRIKKIAY